VPGGARERVVWGTTLGVIATIVLFMWELAQPLVLYSLSGKPYTYTLIPLTLVFLLLPDLPVAFGGVLVCAMLSRAAECIEECAAAVGGGDVAASADSHSDGPCVSATEARTRVMATLRSVFPVIRVAQFIAMCTFAHMILDVIVAATTIKTGNIIGGGIVFGSELLLPVFCVWIIVFGIRVTTALQALHLALLDPETSRGGGGSAASDRDTAIVRDLAAYMQGLESKVRLYMLAALLCIANCALRCTVAREDSHSRFTASRRRGAIWRG
jgi:hypothetical protein